MPMSARRHNFRDKTMELLNAMIVIYSEVFHKSTTVEGIRDAGPAAFGNDLELHILFQRARQALPEFCKLFELASHRKKELTSPRQTTKSCDRSPPWMSFSKSASSERRRRSWRRVAQPKSKRYGRA
jgi:hypothetical protein